MPPRSRPRKLLAWAAAGLCALVLVASTLAMVATFTGPYHFGGRRTLTSGNAVVVTVRQDRLLSVNDAVVFVQWGSISQAERNLPKSDAEWQRDRDEEMQFATLASKWDYATAVVLDAIRRSEAALESVPHVGIVAVAPTWLIRVALAVSLLTSGIACLVLLRRRHFDWQCPHCHYDRTGLPPHTPCPECGTPPLTS